MPPRYSYWTILAGGLPTAFRAAERDDLRPTFERIRQKHPDAEMKWFAHGKLWPSQEAARDFYRRDSPSGDRGPRNREGRARDNRPGQEKVRRRADWRPGGEHRDPRQPFKDAKKERNQDRRKERFDRKQQSAGPRERPHPSKDPSSAHPPRGETSWRTRPPHGKPHGDPLRGPASGRSETGSRKPADRRPPKRHESSFRSSDRSGGFSRPPGRGHSERPHRDRPFQRKPFVRGQGVEEPPEPDRPPGPNREPHPDETPTPAPPPRPNEPTTIPPGPPERGNKGPRRDNFKHRRPRS